MSINTLRTAIIGYSTYKLINHINNLRIYKNLIRYNTLKGNIYPNNTTSKLNTLIKITKIEENKILTFGKYYYPEKNTINKKKYILTKDVNINGKNLLLNHDTKLITDYIDTNDTDKFDTNELSMILKNSNKYNVKSKQINTGDNVLAIVKDNKIMYIGKDMSFYYHIAKSMYNLNLSNILFHICVLSGMILLL
jgi:hypothetical protein